MRAALIGYGKMGHAVERFLLDRGHDVTCRIDAGETAEFDSDAFMASQVAIEFSCPSAAIDNYRMAMEAGVPVVSGTTGWTTRFDEVKDMLARCSGTLFWSSNFSIGVNLFMRVNSYLAGLMEKFPQYRPAMQEIHHIHKLDHPSGTAITLADGIIASDKRINGWYEPASENDIREGEVPVSHVREGEVPGTHIVEWTSGVDAITICHKAFSRDGFALGAVMAAEWVVSHPAERGLIGMERLLPPL